MERKKTKKADLESKRIIFIEIGLVLALAVIFGAFEWKTYEKQEFDLGERQVDEIPEEQVIQTQQNKPPPPPKPKPQTTILEIVEDDVEIEDELIIDAEADQETEIEEYTPIMTEEEEVEEEEIFTVVEQQPSFPGGERARIKYLQQNIEYPQMARESGISGTVYVSFVVEKNGKITDVQVLRGIGGGCDKEAIRVVKNMPKWNAGKQRGKPVRVRFNMPIRFTLH